MLGIEPRACDILSMHSATEASSSSWIRKPETSSFSLEYSGNCGACSRFDKWRPWECCISNNAKWNRRRSTSHCDLLCFRYRSVCIFLRFHDKNGGKRLFYGWGCCKVYMRCWTLRMSEVEVKTLVSVIPKTNIRLPERPRLVTSLCIYGPLMFEPAFSFDLYLMILFHPESEQHWKPDSIVTIYH